MRRRPSSKVPKKLSRLSPKPVPVPALPKVALPDPPSISEKISSISMVLEPKCAVALSPFRDRIIAARLQGMTYRELEEYTTSIGGLEGMIPSQTLHRNLSKAIAATEVPLATELAEERDLNLSDFDATRELQAQILVQRERINGLTRREKEKRVTHDGYLDPRLSIEMTLLNDMIRTLRTIKSEPVVDPKKPVRTLMIPDTSMEKLAELILSGTLEISAVEEIGDVPTFH